MRCLDNYILYTYSSKRFANRQNNCVMLDYFKYMYTRVKKKERKNVLVFLENTKIVKASINNHQLCVQLRAMLDNYHNTSSERNKELSRLLIDRLCFYLI